MKCNCIWGMVLTVFLCISGSALAVLTGSGTQVDPYLIQSRADFDEFANPANAGLYWASGMHTKLMCDIDLAGTTYTQAVIAPQGPQFTGFFDGNSNIINNPIINQPSGSCVGLFGYVGPGGQICNLGVEDVNITGYAGVGGLAGINSGTITGCYTTGLVSGTGYYVGGIVGQNYKGTIINCYSTGSVSGNDLVGGLVGYNSDYPSFLISCYAIGAVSGTGRVGGIVGVNIATVTGCFWDTLTSGKKISSGGTGIPTDTMHNSQTYLRTFWDFKGETINGTEDIWTMPTGGGYPILSWQIEDSAVSNDEMDVAVPVTAGSTISSSSVDATGLDITGNGYNDCADVWYYFDCTEEGKYTITVEPNGFNSTLGVFDAMQREIIFNDDFFGEKSVVILNASAGRRYYIRIAGYDGQTGNFTLTVAQGAIQAVQGDVNYDGFVNLSDFAIFANNWLVGLN